MAIRAKVFLLYVVGRAAALEMPVFGVGRPILPLDRLSSYRFAAADYATYVAPAVGERRPVVIGLEHGGQRRDGGPAFGAVCVVDAARSAVTEEGGGVRAPLLAVGRYARYGEREITPWRDDDFAVADEAEVLAHDAWLFHEATVGRGDRTPPVLARMRAADAEKVRRFAHCNAAAALETAALLVPALADFAPSRRELYSFALCRLRELEASDASEALASRSTEKRLLDARAYLVRARSRLLEDAETFRRAP